MLESNLAIITARSSLYHRVQVETDQQSAGGIFFLISTQASTNITQVTQDHYCSTIQCHFSCPASPIPTLGESVSQ